MESHYQPLSASIHLDFPPPPRSLEALYNPKLSHPRRSRILFHETVHFWQYLNSGYLMRIVEEDWGRLAHFEKTGERRDAPRRQHYRTKHQKHSIAPRQLVEVFARFWDVQVVGPPALLAAEIEEGLAKAPIIERYRALERGGLLTPHSDQGGYRWESFELAMEGPGGGWAQPYATLRNQCPTRAASIFFPVAAALSLKTDDPVSTYMFLMSGVRAFEHALKAAESPHQLWRWGHDFLFDLLTELPTEQLLGTGIKVAGEGPLGQTALWKWLISYTLRAAAEIAARDAPDLSMLEAVPKGINELSFLLACPGDSNSRSLLVPLLLPSRVTYSDGSSWSPAKDAARSLGTPEAQLATFDQVGVLSGEIAARWSLFQDVR